MDEIRSLGFCPHCGNNAPQRLIHAQSSPDTAWTIDDHTEVDYSATYFVAECEVCHHVLLYGSIEDYVDEDHFTSGSLLYPESGKLHASVPSLVAAPYAEAFRIMRLAPNAFAVQIRRALEALCEDRGASKGSLQQRLAVLAERGEIPSTLAELSDALRLIGNVGAHASSHPVQRWQVHTLDEFFRTIVEYVYVAPSKLEEFKESLASFSRHDSEEDSSA